MNTHVRLAMRQIMYGLALVFILFQPVTLFAQRDGSRMQPIVQLGNNNTDNNMRMKVTKEQLFAYPELVCKLKGCEVTSFTISFAPKGEGISGPYKTNGSKIKEEQLQFLRISRNPEIKIFFEDIHVKNSGKDVTTKPLVIICTPNG